MKTKRWLITQWLRAALLLGLGSTASLAQSTAPGPTSGTGTLQGLVSTSVQLSSSGAHQPSLIGAMNGDADGTSTDNDALGFTINFGELSPQNSSPMVIATVPLQVRGNAGYTIKINRSGALPAGPSTTGALTARDIGVGLGQPAARDGSGDLLMTNALTGLTFGPTSGPNTGGFGTDPETARIENGKPVFAATLGNVNSNQIKLVSGNRVSKGGTWEASTNAIILPLKFAIAPQYFTPTASFMTFVTLSIGTP